MDYSAPETLEKIRLQFESSPYPRIPLEKTPKDDKTLDAFYIHSLVTPYYLQHQQVIDTHNVTILDAGCGSGYKCLTLAEANPGAKIVGIDLSEESVKLARQRLDYHGIDNAEFHTLLIEDLPQLGLTFDYINCDEVLYLLPDPVAGLRALHAILKPQGIIRSNLHSFLQRRTYYRAQSVFKLMGFMEDNPGELEVEQVQEIMMALKDQIDLKIRAWDSKFAGPEGGTEAILMNYLLVGDKGYTIPDMFQMFNQTGLELVSMVKWRDWELTELFKDPDDLPAFLAFNLPELSIETRLHLFELLHPVHRLLDFWCSHQGASPSIQPISTWTLENWGKARIHINPLLRQPKIRDQVIECINSHTAFNFSSYFSLPSNVPITVESSVLASLLPLWDEPQAMGTLIQRWLNIRPVDPATLEPTTQAQAFEEVRDLLTKLEVFLFILIEQIG